MPKQRNRLALPKDLLEDLLWDQPKDLLEVILAFLRSLLLRGFPASVFLLRDWLV